MPTAVIKVSVTALRQAADVRPAGYVEDVLSYATSIDGDIAYLPLEAYQSLKAKYRPGYGPGTELKVLLKSVGIEAKPNCSCNKRARLMDERGCDWCEENIEEISGWLAEEAKKRKLPYVAAAGKLLIRMAIKRARRTLASKEEPR